MVTPKSRSYVATFIFILSILKISLTKLVVGLTLPENQYCEIWNATAVQSMQVQNFCFETSITECLSVNVWYMEGPYTGDTGSIQGLFEPDPAVWIQMCNGTIEPQAPPSETVIPFGLCTGHILPAGQTHAYFIQAEKCPPGHALDAVSNETSIDSLPDHMAELQEGTTYERTDSQCAAEPMVT